MTSSLSLQLYSVRDAIEADLRSALERVAEIGFRQVELFGFVERADEYAALLPQLGLSAPSGHVKLVDRDIDVAAVFTAAKAVGIETVIDPWTDPARWTTREGVDAIAARLGELTGPAADAGLRIGYHNHEFELASDLGGVHALEYFADRLDADVVLELDTYWAAVGGADPVALLGRLGDRVQLLHVKDGPATRETSDQLPAGQGVLDVPGILAAAPSALRVVEFDDYAGDIFAGVEESVRYLVEAGEAL